MQKKLLFIWKYPLTPSAGGVERVTSVMINELNKYGYECHYLNIEDKSNRMIYLGELIKDFNKFLYNNNFDVIINQDSSSKKFTEILTASKWKGLYIVFCHFDPIHYLLIYSFKMNILEIFKSDKSIYERTNWIFRALFFPIRRIKLWLKLFNINNINYEKSDYYVLLSDKYEENFKYLSKFKNYKKLKFINNPLSFDIELGYDDILRKKKQVLIVARMEEHQKRISLCLRIWNLIEKNGFEDWSLNIVGEGPDLISYQSLAKNLNLKRINFHGKVDSLPFYRNSSIFMMTSLTEGWGITLTESLQTGVVPVVMGSYLSLQDIIKNGYNGLISKNNDLNEYYDKLTYLMLNDDYRIEMAINGISSSKKFSKENILFKWIDIIE